jgi:hypothetical protein
MFHATGKPGWMRFGGYAAPYQNPDPNPEKQAFKNQSEALQSDGLESRAMGTVTL